HRRAYNLAKVHWPARTLAPVDRRRGHDSDGHRDDHRTALGLLLLAARYVPGAWLHRMTAILSEAIHGLLSESDPTSHYRSGDAATQPCELPSPRRARR